MTKPDCLESVLRAVGLLFGGSTLIACEQTGRRCSMAEIDALYTDIILQRWEQFTGQKAERIAATEEVARAEG